MEPNKKHIEHLLFKQRLSPSVWIQKSSPSTFDTIVYNAHMFHLVDKYVAATIHMWSFEPQNPLCHAFYTF